MTTRWLGLGALVVAVALTGACADETTGESGDSGDGGGGTEEVSRHLESLEAAYEDGNATEVESHLGALEDSWDEASSDVSDSDQVQEMIDSLQSQIDADAPPEEVAATVQQIDEALTS
jgi:hypothetical protein